MTTDYGSDIHTPGGLDLDRYFTFVAGAEAVLEVAVRGLSCAPGSLVDDPEWGYDLRAHANDHDVSPRVIEAAVVRQLLRDERVRRADAAVTFDEATGRLTVACRLVLAEGVFRLVLDVSAVSVAVLTSQVP